MRKQPRWTDKEVVELKELVRQGGRTYGEIAEILGRGRAAVTQKAQSLGLRNDTYLQRITKHKHLRRRAMTYYLTHSAAETQKQFGLTAGEFKSLLTVSYMDPTYAHLRKDVRRHDEWSFREKMMLLRHAGLRDRSWIARLLERGTMQAIKEETVRLGIATRYVNGLPQRLAEELLGEPVAGLKTKAGPGGPHAGVDGRPILVPWVVIHDRARRSRRLPAHLIDALGALALFQRRIHYTRGVADTLRSIERILAK